MLIGVHIFSHLNDAVALATTELKGTLLDIYPSSQECLSGVMYPPPHQDYITRQ